MQHQTEHSSRPRMITKTNTALTPASLELLARVKQAKQINRLTIMQIAKEAGMHQPTVTNQLNGHFNLDIRVVLAVAKLCPNVSAEFLLRGNGEALTDSNDNVKQEQLEARVARLERLFDRQYIQT